MQRSSDSTFLPPRKSLHHTIKPASNPIPASAKSHSLIGMSGGAVHKPTRTPTAGPIIGAIQPLNFQSGIGGNNGNTATCSHVRSLVPVHSIRYAFRTYQLGHPASLTPGRVQLQRSLTVARGMSRYARKLKGSVAAGLTDAILIPNLLFFFTWEVRGDDVRGGPYRVAG